MSHPIVELFDADRLRKVGQRRKTIKLLLWLLAFAALGVCVYLTTLVNTRNIYRMLLACICVSVGTAWIIIYFGIYYVRDAGRELEYAEHLTEGEREIVEGRVSLVKLKVRIRNSVTLRKVRVETDHGPVSLSIHIDKADQLKKAGKYLRLYVTHGYITAYEVMDHADT